MILKAKEEEVVFLGPKYFATQNVIEKIKERRTFCYTDFLMNFGK
jgi:hypothetical protein